MFLISSGQFEQNKPTFSKVTVRTTINSNNVCLSYHVLYFIMLILPKLKVFSKETVRKKIKALIHKVYSI